MNFRSCVGIGVAGLVFLAACGGTVRKPASSSPVGSSPSSSPTTAPLPPADVPADPSPNVLRDRRGDAGIRAPAKPLVHGKASSVQCGKLKRAPSDSEPNDLLAGRLRVRPPVGSKVPPPLPDGPAPEEESRIIADGKVALAVVARETFQLDPDLYEAEPDAPVKPGSLDVEAPKFLKATFPSEEPLEIVPVEIGPTKMRAYAARPPHPNAPPGKDTALVLALLVAQDDGALESVAFYVRGETVRSATGDDLVGCTRLAERIASTLVPGPRKLERAARRVHIADVSKDEELAITVPADYVAVPSKTAKASGARLSKLRPLSLYAGSIHAVLAETPEAKAPEGADTTVSGTLLGKSVEWHGKKTPKGGFLFASEPLNGRTLEVLLKATRQSKTLDEMRTVVETLAIVKR